MTSILPILTATAVFVAAAPLAMADDPAAEKVPGNALVHAAIDSVYQQPGIEAKVRQRGTIFGQLLSGAGMYVQARDENRLLIRLEFQIQVADQRMALLQINDGAMLWIRRDLNELQSQAHVDLRKLREALTKATETEAVASLSSPHLAIGGVGHLLQSFSKSFDFGEAKPTEVGNLPMWEVAGAWKKEPLAALLPNQKQQIEAGMDVDLTQLPSHLPTNVKLTLGRDRNFPLFPYRIEYGRLQPAATAPVPGTVPSRVIKPMLTMELFEVRRRTEFPRELFIYSPGDQNVDDETESYVRRLRSVTPVP